MSIQLPAGKKGERQLKRMLKPVRDRAVNESLPEIPGATELIVRMEKDIAGLKKRVKTLESRSDKLWLDKVQRDMASLRRRTMNSLSEVE